MSVVKLVEALKENTMVLFNCILFEKRVIVIGYNIAAGDVASLVLSTACLFPMGSLLKSKIYPYVSFDDLTFLDHEGYIIGVCNPMFKEKSDWYDVMFDINEMTLNFTTFGHHPFGSKKSSSADKEEDENDYTHLTKRDTLFIQKVMGIIANHKKDNKNETDLEDLVRGLFRDYLQDMVDLAMGLVNTKDFLVAEHRLFKQSQKDKKDKKKKSKEGKEGSSSEKVDNSVIDMDEHQLAAEVMKHQSVEGIAAPEGKIKKRKLKKYTNYFKAMHWKNTSLFKQYKELHAATFAKEDHIYTDILRLRYSTQILTENELKTLYQKFIVNIKSHDQIIEFLSYLPDTREGLYPVAVGIFHPAISVRSWVMAFLQRLETVKEGHACMKRLNKFIMLTYENVKKKDGSQNIS